MYIKICIKLISMTKIGYIILMKVDTTFLCNFYLINQYEMHRN